MEGTVNSPPPSRGRGGRHAAKSRLSGVLALLAAMALAGGTAVALAGPAIADPGQGKGSGNGGQSTGDGTVLNPYDQHQGIPICHRTNSDTNPYVAESPDFDSITKNNSGHDSHDGPVWELGLKAQKIGWGDIIPSFWYTKNGSTATYYPGMNWETDGQAIWNRGCQIPSTDSETPNPTTTVTSTETTSATSTVTTSATSTETTSATSTETTSPTSTVTTTSTTTEITAQIEVLPSNNVEAVTPPVKVLGVSQELPPAPAIAVKPAAQVAPAPSANAHTGQGQSPWVYLLFGAGALLLLGAWRVRRNGNA